MAGPGNILSAAADAGAAPDDVLLWRLRELLRAGYEPTQARALATRPDVDLHRAVELLGAGCPPGLAYRILV